MELPGLCPGVRARLPLTLKLVASMSCARVKLDQMLTYSGAAKLKVPSSLRACRSIARRSPKRSALPKSPSFQVPSAVRNTFSLFTSRCTTPCAPHQGANPKVEVVQDAGQFRASLLAEGLVLNSGRCQSPEHEGAAVQHKAPVQQ